MKLTGQFSSPADVAKLLALDGQLDQLERVPSLDDVRRDSSGRIRAIFTPRATFVPMPFAVVIAVEHAGQSDAALKVHASRGPTAVDVQLKLEFDQRDSGTSVSWHAEVAVRGPGASVGQRVVRDLVSAAIDEVLRETAAVAA
ncbi:MULTISPECIES: SRPBCC domain-containing protein [Thermocrispum]|jgi:carbon monoxide dehydrogenase subunit G|uniref:SRPBCC domain-containing protein n=1 Tax=Thermocrispum agreste TaxID=37925 RepID=A0A2W4LFP2_9PSEU|nr:MULTISPECIES: SRPBCC domain-containing protein [Thermocrispum]PZM99909.1 MAG: hypothetical protein DIU77_04735 [Thermocrispum agreste]